MREAPSLEMIVTRCRSGVVLSDERRVRAIRALAGVELACDGMVRVLR